MSRAPAFITVGAIGFLIQIGSLALMTTAAGWPYEPATAVAVQLAVLHNFMWHERWTWRDRTSLQSAPLLRFARYELTTGATAIVSNLIGTAILVERFGMHAISANAMAVALMSVVNFIVADRWVFSRAVAVAAVAAITAAPASASAADLRPETVAAWNGYVEATETRLNKPSTGDARSYEPYGDDLRIPNGTIHDWHGSTWIRGTTVDAIVFSLTHPGTPPPQDDVLESRVVARSGDAIDVYLKLIRRTIVTVTYDTEHRVTFTRPSPQFATSRSVSTKIAEIGSSDHGFLWRLNSYWRYSQIGPNVLVEVESLSLSREIPAVLRPIAAPIINRIARESMERTLAALRNAFEFRNSTD